MYVALILVSLGVMLFGIHKLVQYNKSRVDDPFEPDPPPGDERPLDSVRRKLKAAREYPIPESAYHNARSNFAQGAVMGATAETTAEIMRKKARRYDDDSSSSSSSSGWGSSSSSSDSSSSSSSSDSYSSGGGDSGGGGSDSSF